MILFPTAFSHAEKHKLTYRLFLYIIPCKKKTNRQAALINF